MREESINLIKNIDVLAANFDKRECYLKLISLIDATTLDVRDSGKTVEAFTKKVMQETSDDALPNVASICVYPQFIENVAMVLGEDSPVAICSVGGGFPAAQTFLEVKMFECAMAIESGADEIDVVINVGDILHGDGQEALSEIKLYSEEFDGETLLKVIIESGALQTEEQIAMAARIAIEGGAQFVKTSTGKVDVGATLEAVTIICEEIKAHYEATGKMVGVKVSGGVSDCATALRYYTLVATILGEKWLNANYFRIGASSLLNKLIDKVK